MTFTKKSLVVILIILILAGAGYFAYTKGLINFDFLKKVEVATESVGGENILKLETYIYADYAKDFSIELPKGYTPSEMESEGGPSISIMLPNRDLMVYVSSLPFWEETVISSYKYIKDERIGGNVFKVYSSDNQTIYWLKNGNQGYEFRGDVNRLKTFRILNLIDDTKPQTPKPSNPESDIPTPPKTNTTTTYMCGDKVKIVRVQDLPSLPPRISYIRVSDGSNIAYYGDFGAYIYPEYFNIDRKQIEQGYSFNEEKFCKYLKN